MTTFPATIDGAHAAPLHVGQAAVEPCTLDVAHVGQAALVWASNKVVRKLLGLDDSSYRWQIRILLFSCQMLIVWISFICELTMLCE